MIILQLLAGLFLLLVGIGGVWAAGSAFLKSSEPETTGAEATFYGCIWTVGLIGGIILGIAGLFIAVQAFG